VRLDDLLVEVADHVPDARLVSGPGDVEVTGVTHDSRRVEPGWCFACIQGGSVDGHSFAPDAVARGAAALLTQHRLALDVAEVQVDDTRAALGWFAGALWRQPSRRLDVIGVTGTNGKTTVTRLLAHILRQAARPTSVLGTLDGVRTTPEAGELQCWLAGRVTAGERAAAIEVSSHGLALHRVDGVHFAAAVFTNLGRDHLDFHPDLRSYFEAKASLFEQGRTALGVVCEDDPWGRRLLEGDGVVGGAAPMLRYGLADASGLVLDRSGARFTWRGHAVHLPLLGRFNVANAIGAATTASALGVPAETVAAALATAPTVPGRFEVVTAPGPAGPVGVVDYAHTPDALAVALETAREVAGGGRVVAVFGCGGDRDREKRPRMGRVAAEGADLAVVTSDNPRSEDPRSIIAEIVASEPRLRVEPDRRRAIFMAVAEAGPADVVLVAGKGHERTQTIGQQVLPFDDREVLAEALAAAAGT
jgi:UDP-N-acetylmuramoyl-L-alanyl-D-glutamate--2,6-diaminopimelate ligase